MESSFAGIVGGALTLLVLLTLLVCFFIFQFRKFTNKDSETGSSDPSAGANSIKFANLHVLSPNTTL